MRILHVFRSPVGGLFRHVRDLAKAQQAVGHDVGIFCDASSGGDTSIALLKEAEQLCSLGITRIAMPRLPGIADFKCVAALQRLARESKADVLHGHGAKGGLYARLAAKRAKIRSVYSPHGGSLHYQWKSPAGVVFLATEKLLARFGSGFVFVCDFERELFGKKIGLAGKPAIVVHNGLWPQEFAPALANINAKDLLFVGEVRHLKGIDILLEAIALLKPKRKTTLSVVGDGPELESYRKRVVDLGLSGQVSFEGRKAIREAFKLGRVMVMPSRHESFPYVVLEAAAAAVPLIATAVGGIPEILPGNMLIARPDARLLADKLLNYLENGAMIQAEARALSGKLVNDFAAPAMAKRITDFYSTLKI